MINDKVKSKKVFPQHIIKSKNMAPNPAAVIIILVLLIVGIVLYYKFNSTSGSTALSSMTSAATMQTINYNSMASSGNSSNCTYSIWFYISDWDTNLTNNKIVFAQSTGTNANGYVTAITEGDISQTLTQLAPTSSSTSSASSNISSLGPVVYFTAMENDMQIYMPCSTTYSATTEGAYVVTNIPLQRWVNLLMSVYGRTLDIYLDGKLVQTQVLPGPLMVPANSNVYITPCTGFGGWTSNFQFIPNATNPQGAWNIYQAGNGKSFLSSVGGQNQMTVTFTQNGNTTASYTM